MEQKIYKSSFRTGPDATKKQQMLFATDTAYALSEGYNCIEDSQGVLFQILNEHNLVEIDDDSECLCDDCRCGKEPVEIVFDPTMGDTPKGTLGGTSPKPISEPSARENMKTIDLVIHNTLNQREPLRVDQVDSLLKLGQLKEILGATL
jgi:hypothetical protein